MNAPRVLIAGAVLGQPMGGVRRHNQELLPRAQALLARGGGGLSVLAGAQPPALDLPGDIALLPSRVPAGPPLKRAWREGRALNRALALAREQGRAFDLVHTAHLPAPRQLSVPYCLLLHDLRSGERSGARGALARAAIADGIRRADRVLCVSALVLREVRERYRPRASDLVGNGCDHLPLLPRKPAAEAFLLHVGHLEERKDLETLLAALALDRDLPPLRCVGSPKGRAEQHLLTLARELDIEDRLELLGPRPDRELAQLYSSAACVVIPSRLEGFGIPALEALRAGTPLALSSAAAAPHDLEGRVPTFGVGDPAGCARAIRAALGADVAPQPRLRNLVEATTWDVAAGRLVRAWTRTRNETQHNKPPRNNNSFWA